MIGALWTGISGLASHQTALDNESHNISNVNTVGYKSSRISFADQMYQDRIGKGSKILDAEKLYVQGNLKLTGVDYDMALSGDGFFTVLNTRSSGTAETLYTRAGNFRMGDNGTLQDAAGNEVQGWAMRSIDTDKDVMSTNPNVTMFTNDYDKLLTSKVVSHSNYIETITAKATDYSLTAKADSDTIFSGAGGKTKSAKISDVEELVSDYANWLQKLKETPDGGSASSTAQISQVNFKSGDQGLVSKEGDQIYVYIDGNKISQNYISTVASDDFKSDFDTGAASVAVAAGTATNTITAIAAPSAENITYEMTVDNVTFSYTASATDDQDDIATALAAEAVTAGFAGASATGNAVTITGITTATELTYDATVVPDFDVAASRVATYKALADKISEIPGFVAHMAAESTGGSQNDVLELTEGFNNSTNNVDMLNGILQIKSLIPGMAFTITEVGEISGNNALAGDFQTGTLAVEGTGVGALESSREALARAITGNQQDVYTEADIDFDTVAANNDFTYSLTIYDKDLDKIIPVPNDNGNPPQAVDMNLTDVADVDDFVTKFNAQAASTSPILSSHVEAVNINGSVVIKTLDTNYDVEFSGNLKNSTGAPIDKNNDYSGRSGAGAEFIEIVSTVDQTTTKSSLQLRLDTLGISDSAFGEFSVDSTGLITMKQDGADFAIGQVAIALFNNNRGLDPAGDNLLAKTNDSGEPIFNLNNDKTAKIEGQTLELSTADLSESLVNLMVFQRAFEANAKSITTSDQLLNTLINLKR